MFIRCSSVNKQQEQRDIIWISAIVPTRIGWTSGAAHFVGNFWHCLTSASRGERAVNAATVFERFSFWINGYYCLCEGVCVVLAVIWMYECHPFELKTNTLANTFIARFFPSTGKNTNLWPLFMGFYYYYFLYCCYYYWNETMMCENIEKKKYTHENMIKANWVGMGNVERKPDTTERLK